MTGVVLLSPLVRDQKVSAFANLTLGIGFAGPWRIWFWATYWDSLFPSRQPSDQQTVKAALKRNLREPGRMAALRSMVSMPKADTASILSQSTVPALVVMGTRDPDFTDPAAEAKWLGKMLNADILIVEGAGHYPHIEMPDQVAPRILTFVSRL